MQCGDLIITEVPESSAPSESQPFIPVLRDSSLIREIRAILPPEGRSVALQSCSKIKANEWLNKNPKNIKQTDVSFHFKDGISESQTVNEMFSNMSRYVLAREQLK